MNTTEITVKDYDTYKEVTVTPMAVFEYGDFSTIFIADATYRGLWLNGDRDWLIDVKEGDIDDAERIEGIFGADEDEWEPPRMRSSPTTGSVSEISIRRMVIGIFWSPCSRHWH
jgi:hypothetical protein